MSFSLCNIISSIIRSIKTFDYSSLNPCNKHRYKQVREKLDLSDFLIEIANTAVFHTNVGKNIALLKDVKLTNEPWNPFKNRITDSFQLFENRFQPLVENTVLILSSPDHNDLFQKDMIKFVEDFCTNNNIKYFQQVAENGFHENEKTIYECIRKSSIVVLVLVDRIEKMCEYSKPFCCYINTLFQYHRDNIHIHEILPIHYHNRYLAPINSWIQIANLHRKPKERTTNVRVVCEIISVIIKSGVNSSLLTHNIEECRNLSDTDIENIEKDREFSNIFYENLIRDKVRDVLKEFSRLSDFRIKNRKIEIVFNTEIYRRGYITGYEICDSNGYIINREDMPKRIVEALGKIDIHISVDHLDIRYFRPTA